MDSRGQDHTRYAKVTSDVKQDQKRKANVTRCHICETRSAMCATPAAQKQRGCHLPACCRKVNGSHREGLEGGERRRERRPHKRAGGRQTHDRVSDVSCHSEPQSKCRRQGRGGSDIDCAQARQQKARRHVRHNCHANADWMSPRATHATQKCMGASGMDSRGGERGRDRGHG